MNSQILNNNDNEWILFISNVTAMLNMHETSFFKVGGGTESSKSSWQTKKKGTSSKTIKILIFGDGWKPTIYPVFHFKILHAHKNVGGLGEPRW